MGPTWVLSAPDGPHVGPMNLAIRVIDPSMTSQKILHNPPALSRYTRKLSPLSVLKKNNRAVKTFDCTFINVNRNIISTTDWVVPMTVYIELRTSWHSGGRKMYSYVSSRRKMMSVLPRTEKCVWISNYTHCKMRNEITFPYPNFGYVLKYIRNFTLPFTVYVITYPCCD